MRLDSGGCGWILQRPQMAGPGARTSGVTLSQHRGRFRSSDCEVATGLLLDVCAEPSFQRRAMTPATAARAIGRPHTVPKRVTWAGPDARIPAFQPSVF